MIIAFGSRLFFILSMPSAIPHNVFARVRLWTWPLSIESLLFNLLASHHVKADHRMLGARD
jgi:hypothetical protein